MTQDHYDGDVVVVQSVLPGYRAPFFARLRERVRTLTLVVGESSPEAPGLRSVAAPAGVRVVPVRTLQRGPLFWTEGLWSGLDPRADRWVLPWTTRHALLLPTLIRARAQGVGTLLWGHGKSPGEDTHRRNFRNAVGRLSSTIVVYAPSARERLLDEGFAPDRVFVAPNAVDTSPVDRAAELWSPERLRAFRTEHGLVERPVVLFVSRLEPSKRLDLLVSAMERLWSMHPDAVLAVVGDGPERPRLDALRAAHPGSVLLPGAIFDEDRLAPWMLSATVMAYPTSIGLSVQHSFAYALPLVTSGERSAHGPEIEAVADGSNGLLFPGLDVGAFAAALARVLSEPELRRQLAAGARATVRTGPWRLEGMVSGFVAALRGAEPRGSRRRRS